MSLEIPYLPFPSTPNARTDIYSQLYQRRLIFVNKPLDDEFANQIIAAMLYLDADDPGKDMQLYINSSGGSLAAGMALYDTIQCLQSDVITVCSGLTAAMGAFLLAIGTKGKRAALPHARILLQQPSIAATQSQATDIEIVANELLAQRRRLNEIYAHVTGKAIAQIQQDTDRDCFLSAQAALDYGLVDQVLAN
jgi:ATP-dependent Clp protease protease subunit